MTLNQKQKQFKQIKSMSSSRIRHRRTPAAHIRPGLQCECESTQHLWVAIWVRASPKLQAEWEVSLHSRGQTLACLQTHTQTAVDKHKMSLPFTICCPTYTHLTALFPGLPGSAGTTNVKPIWILLKQETVSGSGISRTISKSAPRSRQLTTPAAHHSVFTGRMPFLLPNQQRQNTEVCCLLTAQYLGLLSLIIATIHLCKTHLLTC